MMKDEQELGMEEGGFDETRYFPKRRPVGSIGGRPLQILLIIFLIFISAGGVYYFLSRPAEEESKPFHLKITAIEQRISELERQLAELQAKSGPQTVDPALLRRLEVLSEKVESLERQSRVGAAVKDKAQTALKPAPPTEMRYHTVRRGETLYGISKKYGIPVEELIKLNHLSPGRPLRVGQKLILSSGP